MKYSLSNYEVNEAAATATITVNLSAPAPETVTVYYLDFRRFS